MRLLFFLAIAAAAILPTCRSSLIGIRIVDPNKLKANIYYPGENVPHPGKSIFTMQEWNLHFPVLPMHKIPSWEYMNKSLLICPQEKTSPKEVRWYFQPHGWRLGAAKVVAFVQSNTAYSTAPGFTITNSNCLGIEKLTTAHYGKFYYAPNYTVRKQFSLEPPSGYKAEQQPKLDYRPLYKSSFHSPMVEVCMPVLAALEEGAFFWQTTPGGKPLVFLGDAKFHGHWGAFGRNYKDRLLNWSGKQIMRRNGCYAFHRNFLTPGTHIVLTYSATTDYRNVHKIVWEVFEKPGQKHETLRLGEAGMLTKPHTQFTHLNEHVSVLMWKTYIKNAKQYVNVLYEENKPVTFCPSDMLVRDGSKIHYRFLPFYEKESDNYEKSVSFATINHGISYVDIISYGIYINQQTYCVTIQNPNMFTAGLYTIGGVYSGISEGFRLQPKPHYNISSVNTDSVSTWHVDKMGSFPTPPWLCSSLLFQMHPGTLLISLEDPVTGISRVIFKRYYHVGLFNVWGSFVYEWDSNYVISPDETACIRLRKMDWLTYGNITVSIDHPFLGKVRHTVLPLFKSDIPKPTTTTTTTTTEIPTTTVFETTVPETTESAESSGNGGDDEGDDDAANGEIPEYNPESLWEVYQNQNEEVQKRGKRSLCLGCWSFLTEHNTKIAKWGTEVMLVGGNLADPISYAGMEDYGNCTIVWYDPNDKPIVMISRGKITWYNESYWYYSADKTGFLHIDSLSFDGIFQGIRMCTGQERGVVFYNKVIGVDRLYSDTLATVYDLDVELPPYIDVTKTVKTANITLNGETYPKCFEENRCHFTPETYSLMIEMTTWDDYGVYITTYTMEDGSQFKTASPLKIKAADHCFPVTIVEPGDLIESKWDPKDSDNLMWIKKIDDEGANYEQICMLKGGYLKKIYNHNVTCLFNGNIMVRESQCGVYYALELSKTNSRGYGSIKAFFVKCDGKIPKSFTSCPLTTSWQQPDTVFSQTNFTLTFHEFYWMFKIGNSQYVEQMCFGYNGSVSWEREHADVTCGFNGDVKPGVRYVGDMYSFSYNVKNHSEPAILQHHVVEPKRLQRFRRRVAPPRLTPPIIHFGPSTQSTTAVEATAETTTLETTRDFKTTTSAEPETTTPVSEYEEVNFTNIVIYAKFSPPAPMQERVRTIEHAMELMNKSTINTSTIETAFLEVAHHPPPVMVFPFTNVFNSAISSIVFSIFTLFALAFFAFYCVRKIKKSASYKPVSNSEQELRKPIYICRDV